MSHELFLHQLVEHLKPVAGLKAIVLGGSYAHGEARPDSDLDLGLYYAEKQPLDIAHLRAIASRLNDAPDPTLTELGGWGTWVNGGAWLIIGGQRVDWLYRNLDVVRATLDACNTHGMRNELIEELPLI
jgi:predicted nucleotidyltransferase